MKENQKDNLTTGSQSQQTQSNQYGSNPTKLGTPSPKQGTRDEEDEEHENPQAGAKQYESKEQRDGKTSQPQQDSQNRRDEEQRKVQTQPTERQNSSQQTAPQKKH